MTTTKGRLVAASLSYAVVAAVSLSALTAAAKAGWNDQIVQQCTADYMAYCKQYNPESPEVRYCMEAHRTQLSKLCVQALLDAGEVPKQYIVNKQGGIKR